MMKIGVLLKQVPDTETKIKLKDGGGIDDSSVKWVINPYDEYAVEEAIRLKEKNPGSEVVIVTLGATRAVDSMRQAFAMGADRGIRIDADTQLDIYLTSLALSKVINEEKIDIVFAGKQAVDDDASAIVQYVSELLNWPHVTAIEKFSSDGKMAIVERSAAGGLKEEIECSLPAIFGCEKGLNAPRYPSLPGIMKAKTKPVAEKKASELIGSEKACVKTLDWNLPPERTAGRKVVGEDVAVVEQLIKFLKEEVKVI